MNEQKPDYKTLAREIIDDLIDGDKGYDIFRGQPRAGLELLPKAMREEFQKGNHLEALNRFRRECSAFGLEATNDLEDLAVAQHYGLATHLLDWTTNPLVALFFACGEEHDKEETPFAGEVFVLNNPVPLPEDLIDGDKWQEVEDLKLYNPRLIDARIARQKALFTIQGSKRKTVAALISSGDLVIHPVPAELKKSLLEILYRMGIDRSTLFPDPGGLCDRINWETMNRIERNFPPVSGDRVVYLGGSVIGKSTNTGNLTVGEPPEAN
jgi:hypothetical protein